MSKTFTLHTGITLSVLACAGVLFAQPPAGRGGRAAQSADAPCRGGKGPCDQQVVDRAAADRGRVLYAAECVNCHGALARGSDEAPNLGRSLVVLRDRVGSDLGPFLKNGHKTQSGVSTTAFTQAQVAELSHFLKQRVNDTFRGSPLFRPGNVLVGDAKAGAAYFAGDGRCNDCHSPTGDLAGIGGRMTPVQLQQRFMFPGGFRGGRGGRGGGAPAPAPAARKPVTVTVTPGSGPAMTGELVMLDDFFVTLRATSGELHTWKRTPALQVVKNDPHQAHYDLLDRITDKNMHDVTAYLETLK